MKTVICCCEKCGTLKRIIIDGDTAISHVPEQRSVRKILVKPWKHKVSQGNYLEDIISRYQEMKSVKTVAQSFGDGVISFMTILNDLRAITFPSQRHGGWRREEAYKLK